VPAFGGKALDVHAKDIAYVCVERLRDVGIGGLTHFGTGKDCASVFDVDLCDEFGQCCSLRSFPWAKRKEERHVLTKSAPSSILTCPHTANIRSDPSVGHHPLQGGVLIRVKTSDGERPLTRMNELHQLSQLWLKSWKTESFRRDLVKVRIACPDAVVG